MTELSMESPLAQQLNDLVQPKLLEVGWSTGGDDSALAEYIILMLVNGKTQDQIASELSGDLLNLGPDDPGARDFSQWLFEQLSSLQNGGGGSAQPGASIVQDADMGDVQEASSTSIPTGPKNMRGGPADRGRDRRMMGHLARNMDNSMDPLRRVRPHGGNERINTHRAPTGPRGGMNIRGRGGNSGNSMGRGNGAPNIAMSPQQQMEVFAMLEQQAQMIAQMANGGMPFQQKPAFQPRHGQGQGASLFDRVQPNRQQNGFKRAPYQNIKPALTQPTPTSAMDMELTPAHEKPGPDTICRFNLTCKNKDCIFAHQSPEAPPGAAIDVTDVCSFGAACKNRKCTGRHPSPAQRVAHAAEQDCKFYPNCTNARCPFRHGLPPCRNGADCTTPDCKFAHSKVACKFNPCLNPNCMFKHEEGQKRGKFEDKVWVAPGEREHVSERKFVDGNAEEELIIPGKATEVDMKQEEMAA